MRLRIRTFMLCSGMFAAGCTISEPTTPLVVRTSIASVSEEADGPDDGGFNLEVILRGDGFGHVKFRQKLDEPFVVHLDTWVRDLAPNTEYKLQRAVDRVIDGVCTNTSGWATLGKGAVPQSLLTDDRGTAREALFRNVTPPAGQTFDIQFRVLEAATGDVVLTSGCYTYTIRG